MVMICMDSDMRQDPYVMVICLCELEGLSAVLPSEAEARTWMTKLRHRRWALGVERSFMATGSPEERVR